MSSTESRSVREERQTDEVTREPQRSRKSGIFQLGRSNISVCGVRSVKADTVPKSKNCCLGRGRTKERPTLVSRSKSADQPRLSENFRLSKDASNRSLQDGTSIEPHVCGRRYMRKLSDGDGDGNGAKQKRPNSLLSKVDSDRTFKSLEVALESISAANSVVYNVAAPENHSRLSVCEKAAVRKPVNRESFALGRRLASSGRPKVRRESSGERLKPLSLSNHFTTIKRMHRSDETSARSLELDESHRRTLHANKRKSRSIRDLMLEYEDENATTATVESSNTTTTSKSRSLSLQRSPPRQTASLRVTTSAARRFSKPKRQSSAEPLVQEDRSLPRSTVERSFSQRSHRSDAPSTRSLESDEPRRRTLHANRKKSRSMRDLVLKYDDENAASTTVESSSSSNNTTTTSKSRSLSLQRSPPRQTASLRATTSAARRFSKLKGQSSAEPLVQEDRSLPRSTVERSFSQRSHRSDASSTRSLELDEPHQRSLHANKKKSRSMRDLVLKYDDENAALTTVESSSSNNNTTTTSEIRCSSLRPLPPRRIASLLTTTSAARRFPKEKGQLSAQPLIQEDRSFARKPVKGFYSDRFFARNPVTRSFSHEQSLPRIPVNTSYSHEQSIPRSPVKIANSDRSRARNPVKRFYSHEPSPPNSLGTSRSHSMRSFDIFTGIG